MRFLLHEIFPDLKKWEIICPLIETQDTRGKFLRCFFDFVLVLAIIVNPVSLLSRDIHAYNTVANTLRFLSFPIAARCARYIHMLSYRFSRKKGGWYAFAFASSKGNMIFPSVTYSSENITSRSFSPSFVEDKIHRSRDWTLLIRTRGYLCVARLSPYRVICIADLRATGRFTPR